MKPTIVILIVLGLVAAMCAVMLVNVLPSIFAGSKTETSEISVLVATRSISAHTELTKADIELSTIDIAQEGGYYANENSYLRDPINAVGKTVSSDISEGQAITKDKIITDPDRAAILKALKPGMRAYPVRLTGDQIVGGLLVPGCFVDVLTMFSTRSGSRGTKGEAVSITVLEKVKVIAVKGELAGHNSDEEGKTSGGSGRASGGGWTVTLLVDTKQAEELQLATQKGTIALTLRNPLDDKLVDHKGTAFDSSKIGAYSDFFNPSSRKEDQPSGVRVSKEIPKNQVQVIKGSQESYEEVQSSQPETKK